MYFFNVPKASLDTWTKIEPTIIVNGQYIKIKFICEKDFLLSDIIKNYAGVIYIVVIQLSNYLLDIGFHYVLSNKINQDKLEVIIKVHFKKCDNQFHKTKYFLIIFIII